MAKELVKELIDVGVHFGHRASRWNLKMQPYIFGKRNLIHIIDLKETVKSLMVAYHFLLKTAQRGGEVLFVGTKRQAQNIVETEAARCGMHYVKERWLGGTLTNFDTIRRSLNKLADLEAKQSDGSMESYTKKERSSFMREIKKLKKNLSGIQKMSRLPAAMVAVDYRRSKIALAEAKKIGIPTICIMDTDGNPTDVDIPIPANDDAIRVIQIMIGSLAEAIIKGKSKLSIDVQPKEPTTASQTKEKTKKTTGVARKKTQTASKKSKT